MVCVRSNKDSEVDLSFLRALASQAIERRIEDLIHETAQACYNQLPRVERMRRDVADFMTEARADVQALLLPARQVFGRFAAGPISMESVREAWNQFLGDWLEKHPQRTPNGALHEVQRGLPYVMNPADITAVALFGCLVMTDPELDNEVTDQFGTIAHNEIERYWRMVTGLIGHRPFKALHDLKALVASGSPSDD